MVVLYKNTREASVSKAEVLYC